MPHEYHQWLEGLNADILAMYEYANRMAGIPGKVQHLGHRGESEWLRVLSEWLPPGYEIAKRTYILLETDAGKTVTDETDLVIFHPAYPARLREREEVLASGVAAAFSVKRAIGRGEVGAACKAAQELHRGMKIRGQTLREELVPPVIYGLLGQSHNWKAPRSNPVKNVFNAVRDFDRTRLETPREGLDLICIADLGCWSRLRTATTTPKIFQGGVWVDHPDAGVMTVMGRQTAGPNDDEKDKRLSPLTIFVASLWRKLALNDPTLKPFAEGLAATSFTNTGEGWPRYWPLAEVLSEATLKRFESGEMQGNDWQRIFE
jgi:hypothetical protein